jgi:hypothetical protein
MAAYREKVLSFGVLQIDVTWSYGLKSVFWKCDDDLLALGNAWPCPI